MCKQFLLIAVFYMRPLLHLFYDLSFWMRCVLGPAMQEGRYQFLKRHTYSCVRIICKTRWKLRQIFARRRRHFPRELYGRICNSEIFITMDLLAWAIYSYSITDHVHSLGCWILKSKKKEKNNKVSRLKCELMQTFKCQLIEIKSILDVSIEPRRWKETFCPHTATHVEGSLIEI